MEQATTEKQDYPYATYLDMRYAPLDLVDVPALVAACTDRWYNQTLCQGKRFRRPARRNAGRVSLAQARRRR